MHWLLKQSEAPFTNPINQVVCHIANNLVFHKHTKHVDVDIYFVQEKMNSQEVMTQQINTKNQLTDVFIKALGGKCL